MYSLDYRPNNFDEMIGNKFLVREMKKHSINFTYPNVMLFHGKTGNGKTTSSKIIAKTLNCSNPVKLENGEHIPCEKCSSCNTINNETYNLSTTLFDSTTTGGKDDVTKLKEKTSNSPILGDKNVIIVEECHNLSKKAIEVLLPLLEKPRKNMYFILCTTEYFKLPKTLTDRCQRYDFKGLTYEELFDLSVNVLKKENILSTLPESFFIRQNENEKSILEVLIEYCDNSPRDLLSNLKRCVDSGIYTFEEIEEAFGFITEEKIYDIILDILSNNTNVINKINSLKELNIFLSKTKSILTNILIYKLTNVINPYFETFAKKILSFNPNIIYLLDLLNEITDLNYIDKNRLILNIIKYIDYNKISNIRKVKKIK